MQREHASTMGFLETGCSPQAEDGLGIHSLIDSVYGFQRKLAWKVFSRSTLWARVLQQKYCIVQFQWECQKYSFGFASLSELPQYALSEGRKRRNFVPAI